MNRQNDDVQTSILLAALCCGGPLIAVVVISLAPALISFVLTYKIWLLGVGIALALAGVLAWLRRIRRATQPDRIESARVRRR